MINQLINKLWFGLFRKTQLRKIYRKDILISNSIVTVRIDVIISNYIATTQVDRMISNYVLITQVDIIINNYILTKANKYNNQ